MNCHHCDRKYCCVETTGEALAEARYRYESGQDLTNAPYLDAHRAYTIAKQACAQNHVDWRERCLEMERLLLLAVEIMDAHIPMVGFGYPSEELRGHIMAKLNEFNAHRKK